MLIDLFSKWEKRSLFFFFLLFVMVFHVFGFHHISEEVCVLICFFGLFLGFSLYISKVAIEGLKKTWYSWYLEGLDVFNVSLMYIYYALSLLVFNKIALNLLSFYSLFTSFLETLIVFNKTLFVGNVMLYEGFFLNFHRSIKYDSKYLWLSSMKAFKKI